MTTSPEPPEQAKERRVDSECVLGQDDQWDPVKGPSEFVCGGKKPCSPLQDMGLSPAEVKEMTAAWSAQQAAVHRKIVASGGFNWALFNCKSAPTGTES